MSSSVDRSILVGKRLNITIVTDSSGFPYGMAATSRILLLARALLESGAEVTVFCTRVSERPPVVENIYSKGVYQGIKFEYTTGQTTRSAHFLVRRYIEIRGLLGLFVRLVGMKLMRRLDCIYAYISVLNLIPEQRLFLLLARILNVPVIGDFCEAPWTMLDHESSLKWRLSPLTGLKGAVVISHYLENWVKEESCRLGRKIPILYIPILVDIKEQTWSEFPQGEPVIMYAGAPSYDQTIGFILEAMSVIWVEYPKCRLLISGCKCNDPAGLWLLNKIPDESWRNRIDMIGYVPRSELLARYAQASALLIPLFEDIRSQARFPTKIGEYLASGRPTVTTSVGEISHYFQDGLTSFVCTPGDPEEFGKKVLEVLRNPDKANQVGRAGYGLAKQFFDYANYCELLIAFFNNFCN